MSRIDINPAAAARFYFSWGMILWFFSLISIVAAFIVPVPVVRQIGLMFTLAISLLLFFILTNTLGKSSPTALLSSNRLNEITLAIGANYLQYTDCSSGDKISEDNCNGGKLIFVSSWIWMIVNVRVRDFLFFFFSRNLI